MTRRQIRAQRARQKRIKIMCLAAIVLLSISIMQCKDRFLSMLTPDTSYLYAISGEQNQWR